MKQKLPHLKSLEDTMLEIELPQNKSPFWKSAALTGAMNQVRAEQALIRKVVQQRDQKQCQELQKLFALHAENHNLKYFYKAEGWIFTARSGEKISISFSTSERHALYVMPFIFILL